MVDTVLGLPVHVLVVHAVVVLGPIAALMAIAYAVRPVWRRALAWPTAVVTVLAAGSATVAAASGEELEHRLRAIGDVSPALETHTQAGDLARTVMLVFMVITLGAIFWALRPVTRDGQAPATGAVAVIAQVLLVVAGLAALFFVIRAGHTGAEVAWKDVIDQTKNLKSVGG